MRDEDVMTEIRRRWGSWQNFERAFVAGDPDAAAWMTNPRLHATVQAAYHEDEEPAPMDLRARPPADSWAFKDWIKNYKAEPDTDDAPAPEPMQADKTGTARILDAADAFLNNTTTSPGGNES